MRLTAKRAHDAGLPATAHDLVRAAIKLGEVGVVALLGLEVDDEDEARRICADCGTGFGEALKVVALGAIASSSAGDTPIKVLAKPGLEITVSVTAALLGIIVSASITSTAVCLWSAWAPADIVGFDVCSPSTP